MERGRERKGFRGLSTAAAASSCNAAATFDMTEEGSARDTVYKGQEEILRINFNWSSVPIFLQIFHKRLKKGRLLLHRFLQKNACLAGADQICLRFSPSLCICCLSTMKHI